MKQYKITMYELHTRIAIVEATSEQAALDLALDGGNKEEDQHTDFQRMLTEEDLDGCAWKIEEQK